jgi:cation-transporting ATPase 13A2
MILPCDLVLLSGQCIVNESMLSGESLPIIKTSLPKYEEGMGIYKPTIDTKYTLFSGTQVISTRSNSNKKIIGLAFSTGFSTSKGQLIRSILHPKPTKFKFYSDSFKFIGFLFLISLIGLIYTVYLMLHFKAETGEIIKRALDLITIVIPPALPIAMTIGTSFALRRLKKNNIYCISPIRVNVCGRIDLMCFDKTGTLTEDTLHVYSSRPSSQKLFLPQLLDISQSSTHLLDCFVNCHSITKHNGEFIGDLLEIRMFEGTHWNLEENQLEEELEKEEEQQEDIGEELNIKRIVSSPSGQTKFAILKTFEFSSLIQRMSVIGFNISNKSYHCFVKGSPEIIQKICNPQSSNLYLFI